MVGDVVLAHGRERTIFCEYTNGSFGWATESPIWSGKATLAAWRKWALDGEVIYSENRFSACMLPRAK